MAKGHCKGVGAEGECALSSMKLQKSKSLINALILKTIIMNDGLIEHEVDGHYFRKKFHKGYYITLHVYISITNMVF